MAVDAAAAMRGGDADDDLVLALSALCHDMGKPATTARSAEDGRLHAYGHEKEGASPARNFVLRLWNREKLASAVVKMVEAHMRPVALALCDAGPRAYRRLAVEAGRLDTLADLAECDIRATAAPGADPDALPALRLVRAFREKCEALAIEKAPPTPIVQGRDLLGRGLKPGPEFGPLLKECYEAQLGGEISDEASAAAFLDALLARAGQACSKSQVER